MTLYRLATSDEYTNWTEGITEIFAMPVVPCEHGNYARHIVRQNFSTSKYEWCSGAAVGEETP